MVRFVGLRFGAMGVACAMVVGMAASPASAVDVTLRLVNQDNVEIAGSVIQIPVFGLNVPTGTSADLPEGTLSFRLVPARPVAASFTGLARNELAEVTVDTTEIVFEWITRDVLLRLHDQFGTDMAGSQFILGGPIQPTGSVVRLPITDESVYPTMLGSQTDGYDMEIRPAVNGLQAPTNRLRRFETAEVDTATTEIAFEWITSDVVLRLHDQFGVDHAGSGIRSLNSSVTTGDMVTLPITDESVYPNLSGFLADGYGFNLQVSVFGVTAGNRLFRIEKAEVGADTTEIAFEWISSDVVLRLQDQTGTDIPGSVLTLVPYPTTQATGSVYRIPITDEGVYPNLAGTLKDGYHVKFAVGVAGILPGKAMTRIAFVEIGALTSEIAFEWKQLACEIQIVDALGEPVAGSSLLLPGQFPPFSPGDTVAFPVTDQSFYPTLAGQATSFVNGYPITITPGDIAPTSDVIAFEVLGSLEFSPSSFLIGGNTYSLGCIPPDSDGDGVDDVDDACPDSDLGATIVVGGDDTGVENELLADGCSLADLVAEVLGNDPTTAAIIQMLVDLKAAGLLTGQEMGAILKSLNNP